MVARRAPDCCHDPHPCSHHSCSYHHCCWYFRDSGYDSRSRHPSCCCRCRCSYSHRHRHSCHSHHRPCHLYAQMHGVCGLPSERRPSGMLRCATLLRCGGGGEIPHHRAVSPRRRGPPPPRAAPGAPLRASGGARGPPPRGTLRRRRRGRPCVAGRSSPSCPGGRRFPPRSHETREIARAPQPPVGTVLRQRHTKSDAVQNSGPGDSHATQAAKAVLEGI